MNFLSFDVKTTGPRKDKHAIKVIHIYLIIKYRIIKHTIFYFPNEERIWHDDTIKDTWDKDYMKHCENNIMGSIRDTMARLIAHINEIEEIYRDVCLITDNPGHDIAWIDYYIQTYLTFPNGKVPSLFYRFQDEKEWRTILDIDSVMIGKNIRKALRLQSHLVGINDKEFYGRSVSIDEKTSMLFGPSKL